MKWSTLHSPTVADCRILGSPANGYVSYVGGTTVGEIAEFMCDRGYTIAGDLSANVTCQFPGDWSVFSAFCQSELDHTIYPQSYAAGTAHEQVHMEC